MTYMIDAWLDRPRPYLRILNRDTGEVCAQLEDDALDELREQGGLDLHELGTSEPQVIKELVRSLFLFCYARALIGEFAWRRRRHSCSRGRREGPAANRGSQERPPRMGAQRMSSSSTSNTRVLCGGMLPTA